MPDSPHFYLLEPIQLPQATVQLLFTFFNRPTALAKLRSEYRGARELGLVSPIPQQAEVLEHCPYYVACVKESMRICPSVQSIFHREVKSRPNPCLGRK